MPAGVRVQWSLAFALSYQPHPATLNIEANAVSSGVSVAALHIDTTNPNRIGSVYQLRGRLTGPSSGYSTLTATPGTSTLFGPTDVSYTRIHIPGLVVAGYDRSYVTVPLVAAKTGITTVNDPASLDFPDPSLAITSVSDSLTRPQETPLVEPSGGTTARLAPWKAQYAPAALVQRQRL